jgi:DNA-binding Lrp family transcriptional regulator
LDAYVLVHQAEDDVIDRLEQVPDVRFAARTVGAHVAVAVFSGPEITDVVALVEQARRWGVLAHETAIPLRPNPPHIKGMLPHKHEAFVGLTVAPPYERVHRAVAELRQLEITVAVHAVVGRYQVMAELASVDYHDLRDALLLDVPSVEGVTSITSSLAVCHDAPQGARSEAGGMDWFWRDPSPGPEQPELHWGTSRQPGT